MELSGSGTLRAEHLEPGTKPEGSKLAVNHVLGTMVKRPSETSGQSRNIRKRYSTSHSSYYSYYLNPSYVTLRPRTLTVTGAAFLDIDWSGMGWVGGCWVCVWCIYVKKLWFW